MECMQSKIIEHVSLVLQGEVGRARVLASELVSFQLTGFDSRRTVD